MKRLELIIALIISFAVFVIAGFFISGCGGSSSSTTISYSLSSENGTVAIYLTDGPADEYAHIWMYIHKVLLLPSDGGESIVVFEPEEDLLASMVVIGDIVRYKGILRPWKRWIQVMI